MSNIGKKFKLISGHGGVFVVVKEYKAAGFIPTVVGQNSQKRIKTVARLEDIVFENN
jgi:hypothetical protein